MKIKKRINSLILAGISCFSFVACKDGENPSPDESGTPGPTYTAYSFLKGGKSEYSLLLPQEASDSEKMCAAEVNTFLAQAAGITLPIVYEGTNSGNADKYISIGKTEALKNSGITVNYDELLTSGYIVKTIEDDVYIAGGSPGVIYGAYEFLEQELDYHYYSDNVYYIRKNVKEQDLVQFDVKEIPAFQYRCESYGFEQYANTDSMYSLRMRLDESLSIGGGWHNFFDLVPIEEHFENHENWYSPDGTQFCLTRDKSGLAQEVKNQIIEALEENPDLTYYHVGMEDTRTWCDCQQCKETISLYDGYISSTYILFMNEVYAQLEPYLKENNLKTKLSMFAYHRTQEAPVKWDENSKSYKLVSEDLKLNKNVHVLYAPIESDYFYPFTDPNCSNTYKDFSGWHLISDEILLWTYSSYFGNYMLPHVHLNSIQKNYQLARDYGVLWMFNQAEWNNFNSTGFSHLKAYVNAQLAWDPDQDLQTLIQNFCNCYFGDASNAMMNVLDSLLTWRAYCTYELGLKGGLNDIPRDEIYWPYGLVKGWLDETERGYQAIEKYKVTDMGTYKRLHDAITLETLSFRYMLITYHQSYYSETELLEMQKAFKEDATRLNVTHNREAASMDELYKEWGLI